MSAMGDVRLPSRKVMTAALGGLRQWSKRCHEASLHLVRSGVLPEGARVVRGWHPNVPSQHSWVVIGDPYGGGYSPPGEPDGNQPLFPTIIDPTLWGYLGTMPSIAIGRGNTGNTGTIFQHRPYGWGYRREGALPQPQSRLIQLKGYARLSGEAKAFLKREAPKGLDFRGWHQLVHDPVQGWPSAEIIAAAADDPQLKALIPIDIVGNLTDKNPGGLYR